jgi:hypothetical protein
MAKPGTVILRRTFSRDEVALILSTQACIDVQLDPRALLGGEYEVDVQEPITVVLRAKGADDAR